MRAKEFFTEAGLKLADFDTKNNHYWQNFLSMIKNNSPIDLTDGSSITLRYPVSTYSELSKIWDGSRLATPAQIGMLKDYKLEADDGRLITLGKVFKSEKIKSTGGAESVSKFWNLGNIVEGVMGAAITAKFIDPEKEIGTKEIVSVLKSLKAGKAAPTTKKVKPITPYLMNSKAGQDDLTFTMSLNAVDFKALEMSFKNPKSLEAYPGFEEIIKSYNDAANYANTSKTVKQAVDRVVNDKRKNKIIIESEGGSAEKQTSTKADLFITIDGKRERLLSLKSKTVPQVGQVSGHAFDNLETFFKTTIGFGLPESYRKLFPVGSFKEVGETIFNASFPKAYKHIFNSLSKTLGGDDTYKEYNFIKKIYDGILHHATLGEEVIIVYLSPSVKKAYTELKIGPELLESLQEFDLYPVLSGPTTIKVFGRPLTERAKSITNGQEQELVQFRSYKQAASTVRNVIELKSLLKSLTDLDKINDRKNQSTGIQQQTTPASTQNVPRITAQQRPKKPALKASQPTIGAEPVASAAKNAVRPAAGTSPTV